MQFIVITSPSMLDGEAFFIRQLFDCGLDRLHLRKPEADADSLRRLLDALPADILPRITLHDHHPLALDYGLGCVHLNRRNPSPPAGWEPRRVSMSCHSLDEVARMKPRMAYVTLSPVFDSISKQGYQSAFTAAELDRAAADGILDSRVVALGGVSLATIPQLRRWPFGGAALLGDVWQWANTDRFASHALAIRRALDAIDD